MKRVRIPWVRSARHSAAHAALRKAKWPLALCALLAAAWLGRAWLLSRAGRWLNVGERPRRSDYVLVLPGGEESRPFVAAALVRAGLARQALVPSVIGTSDTDAGIERPAHDVIRDVLVLRGVPRRRIVVLGGKSRSTYTDALAVREFLLDRPRSMVAIVTNDYHTRRARWVFRRVLAEMADIHMVAAPHDKHNAATWWQTREGAATYCGEFAKLAGYAVWYGDARVWSGAGLLLVAAALFLFRRRRAVRDARRQEAGHRAI